MKYQPVSEEQLLAVDLDEVVPDHFWDKASSLVASGMETLIEREELAEHEFDGEEFVIPVLLPEGLSSGDARTFKEDSVTVVDDLPIPLMWQQFSAKGHDGAVIVGKINSIERIESPVKGWGNARGVFDTGPFAREAARLVRGQYLRGVSADLDNFTATQETIELAEEDVIKSDPITVTESRIVAATLVAKPAFQEAKIVIVEPEVEYLELPLTDGVYEEEFEDELAMQASIIAAGIPVNPPKEWFDNPNLSKPSPITVDDDGRVFGHIASWGINHIGLRKNTRPPRSVSNYAYFRTGTVRTQEGEDVYVGQLTLSGGHADGYASLEAAIRHYDDTRSAVADVVAGEDAHGIWVAGALRPGVSSEQIRTLRASSPSGDWRPVNGQRLELVAVCMVNVPGFPIARSIVSSGQVMSLVAAGAREIAELNPITQLEERVSAIEYQRYQEEAASSLAALDAFESAEKEALVASVRDDIELLNSLQTEEERMFRETYLSALDKLSAL